MSNSDNQQNKKKKSMTHQEQNASDLACQILREQNKKKLEMLMEKLDISKLIQRLNMMSQMPNNNIGLT